jgi:hypothetical protein
LGSEAAVAEEEAKEAILRVLPHTENEAMTLDDLVKEVKEDGVKRTVAQNAINEMLDRVVCRIGRGVKGDPYRYWQVATSSSSTFVDRADLDEISDNNFASTILGTQDLGENEDLSGNRVQNLSRGEQPADQHKEIASESEVSTRMSLIISSIDEIFQDNPGLENKQSIASDLRSWYLPKLWVKKRLKGLSPSHVEIKEALKRSSSKARVMRERTHLHRS